MSEICVPQERIDRGLYWERAWSLISGCTPVSPGCLNCWSAQQTHIRAGQSNVKIRARYGGLTNEQGNWTGEIRLMRGDLDKPLRVRKPTTWAIWNDLFHEGVPDDFIADVWRVMCLSPEHVYIVLTKRAGRMRERFTAFSREKVLSNVIGMVTAEDQEQADERIPDLLATPFAVRGISVEPLLGPVDLIGSIFRPGVWDRIHPDHDYVLAPSLHRSGIAWVVIGGESGPGARPMHPDWARKIIRQCKDAQVPIFMKQLGSAATQGFRRRSNRAASKMEEWVEDLRVREFPKQWGCQDEQAV